MRFCEHCGARLKSESAKYCGECGAAVEPGDHEDTATQNADARAKDTDESLLRQISDSVSQSDGLSVRRRSAHDLGRMLENLTARILRADGYETEVRRRESGQLGRSEFDIIATRVRHGITDVKAVECKNHSSAIEVKEIRDFTKKMEDNRIRNGLFVALPRFSSEALEWGQKAGLDLWEFEELVKRVTLAEVGRLGTAEVAKLEYCLPAKIGYDEAVSLDIRNRDKVQVERATLVWKPFYRYSYKIKCTRIDPRKLRHEIDDSDVLMRDGMSGRPLVKSGAFQSITKKILGQSEEDSEASREADIVLDELAGSIQRGFSVPQSIEYKTLVLKPTADKESLKKRLLKALIDDYTRIDYYVLKRDEDELFPDQKEFVVAPLLRDIKINVETIYVPKWEIEFESQESRYVRKISANTGATIYDTITYCGNHVLADFRKKKNVAVCGVCGKALCREHVWQCGSCKSWRCETHSKACFVCHERHCPEHIPKQCAKCGGTVCDNCSVQCPICGKLYCKADVIRCSKCGRTVCVSCTRREGGVLAFGKRIYCRDC